MIIVFTKTGRTRLHPFIECRANKNINILYLRHKIYIPIKCFGGVWQRYFCRSLHRRHLIISPLHSTLDQYMKSFVGLDDAEHTMIPLYIANAC